MIFWDSIYCKGLGNNWRNEKIVFGGICGILLRYLLDTRWTSKRYGIKPLYLAARALAVEYIKGGRGMYVLICRGFIFFLHNSQLFPM